MACQIYCCYRELVRHYCSISQSFLTQSCVVGRHTFGTFTNQMQTSFSPEQKWVVIVRVGDIIFYVYLLQGWYKSIMFSDCSRLVCLCCTDGPVLLQGTRGARPSNWRMMKQYLRQILLLLNMEWSVETNGPLFKSRMLHGQQKLSNQFLLLPLLLRGVMRVVS